MNERTQQHLYELNTESRLTRLESTNEIILKTLIEIRSDIKYTDTRMDTLFKDTHTRMDRLFEEIKSDIKVLDSRLWQIIFLISSSVLGLFIGKLLHWL